MFEPINENYHPTLITEPSHPNAVDGRIKHNIELLRQFKQGNLASLQRYSGFGGLRKALKQEAIQAALAEFLSPEEIERLKKSASTGYFTPSLLISFMYEVVQKLGFTHGKVLEPACGHGAFFEHMPKAMREKSEITGIELEPLSAAMAKALYPDILIRNQGFQQFHEAGFDLIIGNPPYATFSVFDREHPDLRDEMIHHYFVAKSARLLKECGLLAMVVPCYVLDNPKRHLRHPIAEIADLVTAYRLPENLFADAKVTVDIVVFHRTHTPKKDWLESKQVELPNGKRCYLSQYFIDHPEHVIGKLDTYQAYSVFEDRPRQGLRCVASFAEVQKRLPEFVNALQPLVAL